MNRRLLKISPAWLWGSTVLIVAVVALATSRRWYPAASSWIDGTITSYRDVGAGSAEGNQEGDSHAGHGGHAGDASHESVSSLKLSAQALRSIGLSADMIKPIELTTYVKSITVPAVVVERPGRTRVQVATPMTGVITHVHAVQGEAVEPGTLLFQIRLTHEDLVNAQTEFVRTLGELEVEEREITRLRKVTQSGAVAGKRLLEREYERDKLEALLRAQREALKLHGLSDAQVKQIDDERRLLRELQIFAPSIDSHSADELKLAGSPYTPVSFNHPDGKSHQHTSPLILQQLDIHKGQSVNAGETLCILTDYEELFIDGMAFEQDINQLRRASENDWPVTAIFPQPGEEQQVVEGLQIAYLSNNVDSESRTLHFYVQLPNAITKDRRQDGNRYIEWMYLPGQRPQLRIPVQQWSDQLVLPVDAVAKEGVESFVFQQNGDHFDRVSVHVKFRDQYSVVIENDGSLFPGDAVAMRGAHQMQMALKNKAGGAVDPHAGHNH